MPGYSHIVIGAGAIGSATAYRLAARGARAVLVLEQFDLINTLGSSGDQSRIIRHSYHRDEYTALTPAMFDAWTEVEEASGLPLYLRTGGLDLARAGTPGEAEVATYRGSLERTGIDVEDLSADDIRRRYPQWVVDDDTVGLYQEAGGLIDIRRAVSAHTALAMGLGVTFLPRTPVTGVTARASSVTVHSTAGDFDADHLVIAAGSWTEALLPGLGIEIPLTLSQEQVSYFASPRLAEFTPEKFPIWMYHGEEMFYGLPVYGDAGVKIARDMRGRFITSDDRVFDGDEIEAEHLRGFLRRHLPGAVGPTLTSRTCVYDMAPDRDFILDVVPHLPHVAVFNGAGHAAKFSALIGDILADLMIDGTTGHGIDAFRLTRPAITDPGYPTAFRLTA
jgi:monomeric sarcosine oxidase